MNEFNERYAGKYYSKYRGRITKIDDPRSLGRVMVVVPSVMGTEEVGLALPGAPESCGTDTGNYTPPVLHDNVWVEFEEGDPSMPIWTGGYWAEREGRSMLMEHARGLPHDTDFSIRDHGIIPPSSFAGTYTNVKIIQSKDGGFIEFDSTPGAERVQIVHRSGSRREFTADGSVLDVVTGAARTRIEEGAQLEIAGTYEETIGRLFKQTHQGDAERSVLGSLTEAFREQTVTGNVYRAAWDDIETVSAGKFGIKAGGNLSLNSGGQMSLMAGQNLVGTVLENFELMVSGATTGQLSPGLGGPDAIVSLIQSFNGRNVLKATDPTGMINYGMFDANPLMSGMPAASVSAGFGEVEGGRIDVLGIPVGNIHLGGFPQIESLVKGTSFMASLAPLTIGLQAFATAVMGDAVLGALAPVTVAAATALNVIATAFNAQMQSNMLFLSLNSFTK